MVNRRRRDHNRLGFAVQLATVRLLGRFLPEPLEVPSSLVQFLAVQLDVGDVSVVAAYGQRLPTQHAHAREIRGRYGYVDLGDVEAAGGLSSFLRARAWTSTEGPTQLFERAVLWLRERKVLLPGVSVLTRLVSEVRAEQAARLHDAIAASVDDQLLGSLDGLLAVTSGRVSDLERLRTGPSRASAPEVLRQHDGFGELARLRTDRSSHRRGAASSNGPARPNGAPTPSPSPRRCTARSVDATYTRSTGSVGATRVHGCYRIRPGPNLVTSSSPDCSSPLTPRSISKPSPVNSTPPTGSSPSRSQRAAIYASTTMAAQQSRKPDFDVSVSHPCRSTRSAVEMGRRADVPVVAGSTV